MVVVTCLMTCCGSHSMLLSKVGFATCLHKAAAKAGMFSLLLPSTISTATGQQRDLPHATSESTALILPMHQKKALDETFHS